MKGTRRAAWSAGALALLASCQTEPLETTAAVRLRELQSCPLPPLSALSIRATGDFPEQRFAADLTHILERDSLSPQTRFVVVNGESEAQGEDAAAVLPLSGMDLERDLLMLPLSRSCPLADPGAGAPADAAVAALPDGSLLIAGGLGEAERASSAAVRVGAGERLASEVPGGMLLSRAGASATLAGGLVVVVGGAPDKVSTAHEVYEIYDPALGRFDVARSDKLAMAPRRDHAALGLADGRVLVVGGRTSATVPPLASAAWIDPVSGSARPLSGELARARYAPQLMQLDSGAVIVAGGRDADEAVVTSLERLDLARERFERVGELPAHDEAVAAALPGERVAWFGCDAGGDCGLTLALLDGGFATVAFSQERLRVAGVADLERLRLLGLSSGRLLATARGRPLGQRHAFVFDVSRDEVEQIDSSNVPAHLLELADGTVAALDAFGAAFLRLDAATAFDDPATELLDELVRSAATHFRREDGALVALADARVDLPRLRFGDLRVVLELEGEGELLFEPAGQAPTVVGLDSRVRFGGCDFARPEGEVVLLRRGGRLSDAEGRCGLASDLYVSLALRMRRGAILRALHVTRL